MRSGLEAANGIPLQAFSALIRTYRPTGVHSAKFAPPKQSREVETFLMLYNVVCDAGGKKKFNRACFSIVVLPALIAFTHLCDRT